MNLSYQYEWSQMHNSLDHLRVVLGAWVGKPYAASVMFSDEEYRIVAPLGEVTPVDALRICFRMLTDLGFYCVDTGMDFGNRTYAKPGWEVEVHMFGLKDHNPAARRIHLAVKKK